MIYLDNASTTQLAHEALLEMMPYLIEAYGNPGSLHSLGIESRKAIDKAREQVAKAINADPEEIVFTSGGSEANNLAIKIAYDFWNLLDVLSSKLEHDSMKKACEYYSFCNDIYLPHYKNESELFENIIKRIDEINTISFMYVNNELGIVNDVKKICEIGNEFGKVTVIDAVQALGNEIINVREIGCDMLAMSSHKIHGPKGVGAIYISNKLRGKTSNMYPLIFGGDNQEFGLRGGTENVPGIVGFGKACEMINIDENKTTISKLRKCFLEGLNFEYKINYDRPDSKIISLTIPGIDAETLVLLASSLGVCISAGSACKSLEQTPNEVLLAAGLSESEARSTVRISLSCYNTMEEMGVAAGILNNCIEILKG